MRLLIAGEPDPANPASIPWPKSGIGRAAPASKCSAMSPILAKFWSLAHISRCCRLVAKACQKVCWKRRPAVDRSSRPMCLAAAKSRARVSTRCLCRRTTRRRSPMPSRGWPTIKICGANSEKPGVGWSKANIPRSGSERISLRFMIASWSARAIGSPRCRDEIHCRLHCDPAKQ